jgi:hypothetical protein
MAESSGRFQNSRAAKSSNLNGGHLSEDLNVPIPLLLPVQKAVLLQMTSDLPVHTPGIPEFTRLAQIAGFEREGPREIDKGYS